MVNLLLKPNNPKNREGGDNKEWRAWALSIAILIIGALGGAIGTGTFVLVRDLRQELLGEVKEIRKEFVAEIKDIRICITETKEKQVEFKAHQDERLKRERKER